MHNLEFFNTEKRKECLVRIVSARGIIEDIRHGVDFVGHVIIFTYALRENCIPDDLIKAADEIIAHIYDDLQKPDWVFTIR